MRLHMYLQALSRFYSKPCLPDWGEKACQILAKVRASVTCTKNVYIILRQAFAHIWCMARGLINSVQRTQRFKRSKLVKL